MNKVLMAALTINNYNSGFGELDLDTFPYISVRVVDGELWYYGASKTKENADKLIEGLKNAFTIDTTIS